MRQHSTDCRLSRRYGRAHGLGLMMLCCADPGCLPLAASCHTQRPAVLQVTKHIRVRAGSTAGESSRGELAAFTPAFVWLLRDFYLSLEDEGQEVLPVPFELAVRLCTPSTCPMHNVCAHSCTD